MTITTDHHLDQAIRAIRLVAGEIGHSRTCPGCGTPDGYVLRSWSNMLQTVAQLLELVRQSTREQHQLIEDYRDRLIEAGVFHYPAGAMGQGRGGDALLDAYGEPELTATQRADIAAGVARAFPPRCAGNHAQAAQDGPEGPEGPEGAAHV